MDLLQILFFAGLAVFIGIRLYMVLGRQVGRSPEEHAREEAEREAARASAREAAAPLSDNNGDAPAARPAPSFSAVDIADTAYDGLEAIADADIGFDAGEFVKGARAAYSMIAVAFAKGDAEALEPLLAPRVLKAYREAIEARAEKGETLVTEIDRIKEARLEEASLNGPKAKIKVRFVAEIAHETRAADGSVVSGDIAALHPVSEIWSFERDVTSDNPNWRLSGVRPA
ncbi:MAG: Tim44 domain-containing protein [Oceanicaulis sp.]|uniref:Tim44/TimA family putative adaptor protein n=1 Tax=Glycocaulis sp. TaxID=1969725 RepID=UPI0025BCF698|nr:Tim44/TimA family putative adaptor protein [Glycocaulis sp.]MCC5980173.1 Tim44 domain-containing protein [Oceanicaulis sp.]MCH8521966.1 Tim44/TimA family putative adaptor protein [Glycocaulis sp.]